MESMVPFYRGFDGTVDKSDSVGEYEVSGCGEIVEIDGQHTFEITELPIGMQTVDYMRFLESIADWNEEVEDPLIEDYTCKWKDDAKVDIKIKIKPDKIASLKVLPREELYEKFKLISTVSTNNMHLFDAEGKIKKFDDPVKILEEFCLLGLSYYGNRKMSYCDNESYTWMDIFWTY